MNEFFKEAKPVWAKDRAKEINLTCVFTTEFDGKAPAELLVTASCLYRVFVNGKFCGYGPARAAHGYYRVDKIPLTDLRVHNTVVIEVTGYNTKSFYTLDQPSFLQAEILRDGKAIAATGRDGGFVCASSHRLQRVPRFSYQRAFTEYYDFGRECEKLECEEVTGGKLLPRGVDYPDYTFAKATSVENGIFHSDDSEPVMFHFLSNARLRLYKPDEWERNALQEVSGYVYQVSATRGDSYAAGEYGVWDLSCIETGFIGLRVRVLEPVRIHILFEEIDGRESPAKDTPIAIDYLRNSTYNVISYELPCGEYDLLSFEAYSARYIKLAVAKGQLSVERVGILRFEHPFFGKLSFEQYGEDKEIMRAAARTLAHNSVDLLTDCPSRERAGWLCDGFFSSRSEKFFTGENRVERNFLENYALCPSVENIPDGMIPMCYPADFEKELFIPNWSLWYILELRDYLRRTGDSEMIAASKQKVLGLLSYFDKFENESGLLENLENWVFVEWSKANDDSFVCGVNYPSNMLYAAALDCVCELYGDESLREKAYRLRETIRERSYNGEFFEDNEVRENGELKRVGHTSETCQYYAFFFGVATHESYPKLWETLLTEFGPNRCDEKVYPSVFKSNAFMGNYMRLEMLLKYGYTDKLRSESEKYFADMARCTGTLWEHDRPGASLDHGFASYIAYLLHAK